MFSQSELNSPSQKTMKRGKKAAFLSLILLSKQIWKEVMNEWMNKSMNKWEWPNFLELNWKEQTEWYHSLQKEITGGFDYEKRENEEKSSATST